MKLRTSYFNPSLLKKNVTRFAPAWVLYSVFWLLILLMMLDSDGTGVNFASNMATSLQATTFLNLCYAFLCAQLLFGDLYNSRMCNALHAMPMRRESWFFMNVVSGMLFSLVPNLVVAVISTAFMESGWLVAPVWLLAMTLQYLFFFGVAVFCAYSVGNRFAMALVYIIINGFSMIAYWLVESLYAPQLYGIKILEEPFQLFCPIYTMTSQRMVQLNYTRAGNRILEGPFLQIESSFWYLVICAAVGLVFMTVGLLLYRRRKLETAGDFMAFKAFSPVFLLLYCLCGGAVGYLFFSLFVGDESLFFLVVGMVIGWFTGRMLLERTVRVFRMKTFIGCGVLLLAFFASLLLTWLDPLGVTRWVPEAQQVKAVHLYTGGSRYDYYKEGANRLTEKADIEAALALHRYGIENRDADYNGMIDVALTMDYELKSGRKVSRYYTVDITTPEGAALEAILSRPEIVLGRPVTDAAALADNLVQIRGETDKAVAGQDMIPLLEAILQDCAQGNMAQDWNFHSDEDLTCWLTLQYKSDQDYHYYRDVRVYPSCKNTMAWLEAHDMLTDKLG